jgi:hypothetical protein
MAAAAAGKLVSTSLQLAVEWLNMVWKKVKHHGAPVCKHQHFRQLSTAHQLRQLQQTCWNLHARAKSSGMAAAAQTAVSAPHSLRFEGCMKFAKKAGTTGRMRVCRSAACNSAASMAAAARLHISVGYPTACS